jgi:undecaprenyl-diphosphatase
MRNKNRKKFYGAVCLLLAFGLWTTALCAVDVQPIGPMGSAVGFAAMNGWFHALTGVHMFLYVLTDWLSLIPLGFVMGFALLGLGQWVQRKYLFKVDRSILVLGGFYAVVMASFLFFEKCVVNFRPVLIEGTLEASYPSSTTMLVMCVMPTAIMQINERVENRRIRKFAVWGMRAFTVFMVLGRLLSGVHWVSDIIGGALLSAGLVLLYDVFSDYVR